MSIAQMKQRALRRYERKSQDDSDDDGGGTAPAILQIKALLQEQGKAWEQFKKTNDELLKAKADGKAVGDLEAKLEQVGKDLDQLTQAKAKVDEILLKLQRPDGASDGSKRAEIEAEVKSFNAMRKSAAKAAIGADLNVEQYTAYKGAFWTLLRKGNPDMLSDTERKALSAGVDSDGGYLLPAPTVGRIVQRATDLSPIRQLAAVQSISTEALEGINDLDEAGAGWTSETATPDDTTTPTVGKYRIEAHEMYAQPKATQRLLDDAAVDVEGWLAAKVADKFSRVENAAFVSGNGTGKPRGFTTYPTAATADETRAWGTIEHIKTGVNGDFAATLPADVLFDLIGAFKPAYLQNATFVTRREVIAKIRKFKEANTNAYLWQPGLQAGQPDRLLGYPLANVQDMPTLAAGSLSLALGDWREAYQIVDKIGIRVLRDPYTAKPYVKFYTTKQVGGGVINFEAVKFLNFAS